MKKRLKTIDGKTATRRIDWWPVRQQILPTGEKAVDVFIVLKLNADDIHMPSRYEVAYAGAQLGIDKKRRKVLPGGCVITDDLSYVSVFYVGARVGEIQEVAQNIANHFNAQLKERHWMPPTGMVRQASAPSNIQYVNEVKVHE